MVDALKPTFTRSIGKFAWANSLPMLLLIVVAIFSAIRPDSYFTATNAQMIASTNAVLAVLALAAVPPLGSDNSICRLDFNWHFRNRSAPE